jgi:glycosyltransferase involved in cell wall biosynthesis
MKPPFFSIVIPTYNRADLILDTLESVLSQTYKEFEVIVVDNCSTDNTKDVLLPYIQNGSISFIQHEKNYERSKSRNTGIKHAKGDYITFLDSDDFLYADCLKDAAAFAQAHPEIKFFQNLYELVDSQRNCIYKYSFPSLDNQYKALASGNFISCIGNFIHRDVYTIIRFDEDPRMIGGEDYEVWFQILARYKMGRINKVNAGIREHPKRSINNGVYENLDYQKNKIIQKIKSDPVTFKAFKSYLSLLEASFILMQVLVSNQLKTKGRSMQLLALSTLRYPKMLFSIRFLKIFFNTIKS